MEAGTAARAAPRVGLGCRGLRGGEAACGSRRRSRLRGRIRRP
jgi:hypothetical protein